MRIHRIADSKRVCRTLPTIDPGMAFVDIAETGVHCHHHLVDQVGSAPNVAAWQSGRRLVKE